MYFHSCSWSNQGYTGPPKFLRVEARSHGEPRSKLLILKWYAVWASREVLCFARS